MLETPRGGQARGPVSGGRVWMLQPAAPSPAGPQTKEGPPALAKEGPSGLPASGDGNSIGHVLCSILVPAGASDLGGHGSVPVPGGVATPGPDSAGLQLGRAAGEEGAWAASGGWRGLQEACVNEQGAGPRASQGHDQARAASGERRTPKS